MFDQDGKLLLQKVHEYTKTQESEFASDAVQEALFVLIHLHIPTLVLHTNVHDAMILLLPFSAQLVKSPSRVSGQIRAAPTRSTDTTLLR